MVQALPAPVRLFDYLALDDAGETRHEYVAGRVYAMTGGSMRHNRIALNVARLLQDRIAGTPCQVFLNDVKLHVQAADSVCYPNVFVYCGSATASGDKLARDALLVVEVMSESTAEIDRREKLAAYQKLPGMRAYWIASEDEQRVEVHERDAAGGWRAYAVLAGEEIAADWLNEPVPLARVHAGTDIA